MNPQGENIARWGKPARLSDFTVGSDYRYLDLPPGEYAYQEAVPISKRLTKSRINVKIPTTAAAFRTELESRTDSDVTKRTTTAVRRPTVTPKRQLEIADLAPPVDESQARGHIDNPDIVRKIKQRSLFHGGKTKKPRGRKGGAVYGSLYGW